MLDSVIRIECDDPALAGFIRELWAPFEVDDVESGALVVEVASTRRGWRVVIDGDEVVKSRSPWAVVLAFRTALDAHALAHAREVVDLHAAVVSRDKVTIALPGGPGAGKTTLAFALLRRGWTLVCDDVAPVRPTGEIEPYPRPLGIRNQGDAWPRLAGTWAFPRWLPAPTGPFLLPANLFPLARHPRAATRVVFPEFVEGAEPRLQEISQAQAMARCAAHVRPLDPRTLGTIRAVCERAPAASLMSGDAERSSSLL